jgi:hypothetical protein
MHACQDIIIALNFHLAPDLPTLYPPDLSTHPMS